LGVAEKASDVPDRNAAAYASGSDFGIHGGEGHRSFKRRSEVLNAGTFEPNDVGGVVSAAQNLKDTIAGLHESIPMLRCRWSQDDGRHCKRRERLHC
jgi:hypothetical protein